MKPLLDYIPLIVFFVLYITVEPTDTNHPLLQILGTQGVENNHILAATAGLIISMLIVYAGLFIYQKFRLEKMQWFVVATTVVFGGITLALSDDYFIRMKAVIINAGFGTVFLLSPFFLKERQVLVQKLFGQILRLSDKGWQRLNLAWVGMFFGMAGLHAFFAFVFMGGRYWGEFTAVGDIAVMMSFMVVMFIVLRKCFYFDENSVEK